MVYHSHRLDVYISQKVNLSVNLIISLKKQNLFKIDAVLLNGLFIQKSWKILYYSFHKNIMLYNCF